MNKNPGGFQTQLKQTKQDRGTIIRTIVMVVALINQGLVMAGWDPLPFAPEDVELFFTYAFTVVAMLIVWFMNNYVTKKGKAQEEQLRKAGLK